MQSSQNFGKNSKRSLFVWGAELLSMTLAVVGTVFTVGPTYGATISWVREYIANQYGAPFIGIASVGWFIAVAIICFGFVSLIFITLINVKGVKLFSRR